ncbi:DUF1573 domain-containing protein [Polluticoccus soli]|uniref:DUF1573 domain-containing protein n=1 Tax=Polluticoccus soli TaxID=3034150 RepID=UPI0023E17388|nr:DUF1573 domain-containing protein [Flavipsychrobacter sp. JY13-12]
MKGRFLIAIALMALVSCKNEAPKEDNKDLLPTDLVSNPRSAEGTDTAAFNALPTMDFKDTLHDFGLMREGETSSYGFEFTNNGKKPLLISGATGSCGCTVADYPREPIQPGQTGTMKVMFNSTDKIGHQEKSVNISTNSKRGTHMLYIKADVKEN